MNRNYWLYSLALHLSLLLVAFIIAQVSQVNSTPKYQKVTIRSIGVGPNNGKKNNATSTQKIEKVPSSSSAEKNTKEPPAPKETKVPPKEQKAEKTQTQEKKEAKEAPKQTKKDVAKEKKETTSKTLKKNQGKDETSRDSKNAALLEDAISSISQEVDVISKNNGAIAKAIAELESESIASGGNGDYANYVEIVGAILKNTWFYPNLGINEKLRTTVRIFVDGQGRILDYRIERSSGREDFDASALRSVQQYTEFPNPPNRKPVDFIVHFNLLEE